MHRWESGKGNGLRKEVKEETKQRAKELRKTPTKAEAVLWDYLRIGRMYGLRFRRQALIRGFIVDFWCPSKKLVIEVDGSVHSSQIDADIWRDSIMNDLGIHVLRLTNNEVLNFPANALERIRQFI